MHTFNKDHVKLLIEISEDIQEFDIREREKIIQSGIENYTTLLAKEDIPSKEILDLYYNALERNADYIKGGLNKLADIILENQKDNKEIILTSLLRAAIPIGSVLFLILKEKTIKPVHHYSISILKDVGIDQIALQEILENHSSEDIVIFDPWTGKGSISGQVKQHIESFNLKYNENINHDLYVLNDISNSAKYSVTSRDFLHPSAILNCTISGLISRSIVPESSDKKHRVKSYLNHEVFKSLDKSQEYVLTIFNKDGLSFKDDNIKNNEFNFKEYFLKLSEKEDVPFNNIKPGICEVTRTLLRRVPRKIILKGDSADTEHIILMANKRNIQVEYNKDLPVNAIAILESKI